MALPFNKMIIKRYEGFGGNFINSEYLGASYAAAKPHVFKDFNRRIFSTTSTYFGSKPLMGMLGDTKTIMIPTEVYRWNLTDAQYQEAVVMENLEAGNTAVGLHNGEFKVMLDLDYFARPDVLMPENSDFPCEIVSKSFAQGGGVIYTLKLQGDNPSNTLPADQLAVGKRWTRVWTSVQSEYNQEFGTQQFPGAIQLENQVGAFAQKLTVTDKMMREQGRLGFEFMAQDANGKETPVKAFYPYAEAMMHNELQETMQAQYVFGKKETRANNDAYVKRTGSGIREQLSESWREFYSGAISINTIKDFLLDIFHTRVEESNRNVVLMTGQLGALLFHDAVASEASGFLTVDSNFVQRQPDKSRRLLSFGAQYTHYQGPNGIDVTMMTTPMYDSKRYTKTEHPLYPGYSIDSGRMTFLDFGSTEGKNNISTVSVENTYRYGTLKGTVGPMGPVKGGEVSMLKAGFDIFTEDTGGVWMVDPTRGGELILDFEF